MIFADLSVTTNIRHLMASLFVARAHRETLVVSQDDMHQLYWLAGGIVSAPSDNDQMHAFSRFFNDFRPQLKAFLPENPELSDPRACVALLERAADLGWVETIYSEWGTAELLLMKLFALPSTALTGFAEYDQDLESFLREPWVGEGFDTFDGAQALGSLGDDASEVVSRPPEPDRDLGRNLMELGRDDWHATGADWYVLPFDQRGSADRMERSLRSDLRNGSLLGTWFVFDGIGEHFTNSIKVRDVVEQVAGQRFAAVDAKPSVRSSLAKPLLRLDDDVRIEDVLELISNARTLEMFADLMAIDDRVARASVKTYVGNLAKLYTPKFVTIITETIQLVVRRRQSRT